MSGGERYLLTLASHWSGVHEVSLFWDDPSVVQVAAKRLHLDLSRVKTTENIFLAHNLFKKLRVTREYDLIFFLTDGSVPTTFAKRNILHFQVPFRKVPFHPVKMMRFQSVVCNSSFTKNNLDQRVGKHAIVIYPPVDPISLRQGTKKNIILSVGRFHETKKQHILIDAFREAIKKNTIKGYELVLAGGLLESDQGYFKELKKQADGFPILFSPNISFDTLCTLYRDARVYWHAAGFGETKPEHMEHFGITTVEAMSAGCIPFAYDAGGQKEIIHNGENGYLWKTKDALLKMTSALLMDKKLCSAVSKKAVLRAKAFDTRIFLHSFDTLFTHITS